MILGENCTVTVTQPRVSIRDTDKEEKAAYLKITKEVRLKEEVKEIDQTIVFSGSDNWKYKWEWKAG